MVQNVETPHGTARAHVDSADGPVGLLFLGHGAGGSVAAPDLVTAAGVARAAGWSVALIEQPYRVAGRRSAAPAHQLDAAWIAVLAALGDRSRRGGPLVVGGRSSGARVACRTAAAVGADAVLCLAFPLVPPRRATATRAPQSREGELDAVTVATLVVQGRGDPFGIPPAAPGREVVVVPGGHDLRGGVKTMTPVLADWLQRVGTGTLGP